MTPARALMHRLAITASLAPPDDGDTQWYIVIGGSPEAGGAPDERDSTATEVGISHALGAPDTLSADATGLSVMVEDKGDVLTLAATLGSAVRAHPASFWRHLLGLNAALLAADRGAITTDVPGHTIYLSQAVNAAVTEVYQIVPIFETFVAQARRLIDVLNDGLPLDDPEAASDTPDADTPSTRTPLMIQA